MTSALLSWAIRVAACAVVLILGAQPLSLRSPHPGLSTLYHPLRSCAVGLCPSPRSAHGSAQGTGHRILGVRGACVPASQRALRSWLLPLVVEPNMPGPCCVGGCSGRGAGRAGRVAAVCGKAGGADCTVSRCRRWSSPRNSSKFKLPGLNSASSCACAPPDDGIRPRSLRSALELVASQAGSLAPVDGPASRLETLADTSEDAMPPCAEEAPCPVASCAADPDTAPLRDTRSVPWRTLPAVRNALAAIDAPRSMRCCCT